MTKSIDCRSHVLDDISNSHFWSSFHSIHIPHAIQSVRHIFIGDTVATILPALRARSRRTFLDFVYFFEFLAYLAERFDGFNDTPTDTSLRHF